MRGTVTAFDAPRGLGTITADDGRALPFHCTALLDGTRTIPVGTSVAFAVRPAGLGRWEATDITGAPES